MKLEWAVDMMRQGNTNALLQRAHLLREEAPCPKAEVLERLAAASEAALDSERREEIYEAAAARSTAILYRIAESAEAAGDYSGAEAAHAAAKAIEISERPTALSLLLTDPAASLLQPETLAALKRALRS